MSYDQGALDAERLDADIETANAIAEGCRIARLHKRGICTHGWRKGWAADPKCNAREHIDQMRARGAFPDRPTNYDRPAEGFQLCLDCGQHVKAWF